MTNYHADASRDGSSLQSLATWLEELDDELNDLTKRIKIGHTNEASDFRTARNGNLAETFDRVAVSVSELLQNLPTSSGKRGASETRLLCMGLVAQWLDHETRAKRSAQAGINGNTASFPLPSVMEFISGQQKTGLLKFATETETFYLEFLGGDLVHASSDNAPRGERLGEILMEMEVLDKQQLGNVIGFANRQRNRLGQELLDRGMVSEIDLDRGLETQIRRTLHRILRQENATFEFREESTQKQSKKLRLPTMPLLLELAKDVDEAQRDQAQAPAAPADETPPATPAPTSGWRTLADLD